MLIFLDNKRLILSRRNLLDSYNFSGIPGYGGGCSVIAARITRLLLELQDLLNIRGNIVEIGVLTGAFFGLIHYFRKTNEFTIGIDCYPENLSPPNGEKTPGWLDSLETIALNWIKDNSCGLEGTLFMNRDSNTIKSHEITSIGDPQAVRFFHVDGDHTENTAFNDFNLAGESLCDGGILVVDDYSDPFSPGVSVAFTRYMLQEGKNHFIPIAIGGNKHFLVKGPKGKLFSELLRKRSNMFQTCKWTVEWWGETIPAFNHDSLELKPIILNLDE